MEYTLSQDGNKRVVTLIGLINEDSEGTFQELQNEIANDKSVVINFSQVQSVNSLGVRTWVSFLRNIEENREITFAECTADIIMQINMIPSFLGKGKVESFFVNYTCDRCDKEVKELVFTAKLPAKTNPETPRCEKQDCALQTEELEDEYFVFLHR